ncbi:MAG: hypothetical protein H6648_10950 [Caldilineae bacterium]|nr:hypothetical protein [Chloroflexota bacterium]MCB9177664.1 hypothetical protein [Caldilineae bacterium]
MVLFGVVALGSGHWLLRVLEPPPPMKAAPLLLTSTVVAGVP